MPLSQSHAALAKQWHPTRNGALTPSDVVAGSRTKVWWKCAAGPDHEWEAMLQNRARLGRGCPFCAGKRASITNCVAELHPALASEWDPHRNGTKTPRNTCAGSEVHIAWICTRDASHRWTAMLANRTQRGRGCPYCARKKPTAMTSLASVHPELAREWHPRRNGGLRPEDVLPKSNRRIWWRCSRGHEWEVAPRNRVVGNTGCPECGNRRVGRHNSLETKRPDLAAEWDTRRNGKPATQVVATSTLKHWWRCTKGHGSYDASCASRVRLGHGCPYCSGQRTAPPESLARRRPGLAKQWHPTKNGTLRPVDVRPGSGRRVWWHCANGPDHAWRTSVSDRAIGGTGCPYCAGRLLSVTNSLATLEPELAAEWHPTRNGATTPSNVVAGHHGRVWWKCPAAHDHEWPATIASRRSARVGCPYCRGLRASVTNSLAANFPHLVEEWSPRNDLAPTEVVAGSHKRAHWSCAFDRTHQWTAAIVDRTRVGNGCPKCSLANRSKREIHVAFEIRQFLEFDLDDRIVRSAKGRLEVDIKIERPRVIIEYDGAHYHRGKARADREKTRALEAEGWRVVRLREHPLRRLQRDDIRVGKQEDVRSVCIRVLRRLGQPEIADATVRAYLDEAAPRGAAAAYAYIRELLRRQQKRGSDRARSVQAGGK